MQILGLFGMYFDAVVVEVETCLLLFRLALVILCLCCCFVIRKLLKPGQNKKGQNFFQLHRFLANFLAFELLTIPSFRTRVPSILFLTEG